METEELFFDEDMEQIEEMREERKKMKDKDFAKLINKKELSDFETLETPQQAFVRKMKAEV